MSDQDEFRVALSLAQMAAVLEHESLSPSEIASNRIYGSLRLVGGIIELAGAGVLCALPDPTMISKAGCIAMGVHAADQLSAATTQVVTGQATDSFAFKAGSATAEALGASHAAGQVIGLATEFAVPLSTASLYNALRVSSVRAGRITVEVSEQSKHAPNDSIGGHTKKLHLDKDIPALQKRLKRFKNTDAMSTFTNLELAEWAVGQVLRTNRLKVQLASKVPFILKRRRLVMVMELNSSIGWGVKRVAPDVPVSMSRVRVVVEFNEFNNMPFYVLTAYPIP